MPIHGQQFIDDEEEEILQVVNSEKSIYQQLDYIPYLPINAISDLVEVHPYIAGPEFV